MVFAFKFPDLGEGVHEGKVVKWLVKEGDTVKADQIIAEIETDKAIVELPSPAAGTLLKIYFGEGQVVKVGQYLLAIGAPEEAAPPQLAEAAASHAPVEHAKLEVMRPAESHKLGVDHEKIHVTTHGDRLVQQAQAPVAAQQPSVQSPQAHSSQQAQPSPAGILATPAVRNLARSLGVDLAKVRGSGPGGRVTAEDVNKYKQSGGEAAAGVQPAQAMSSAQQVSAHPQAAGSIQETIALLSRQLQALVEQAASAQKQAAPQAAAQPALAQAAPAPLKFDGPVERVSISSLRKAVARKMSESVRAIPHVTHFDEADVTDLWDLRTSKKAEAQAKGVHLTLLPFVAKAAIEAMKEFPVFNSSFDEATSEIVYKKYYHLGIAVDTPDGLIVVVVKDADKLGIYELAGRINDLAARARERKASLDEIRGSTFTITNIGSVGGTGATPIINHPESAILGVYRMREQLRVGANGAPALRKIMPLTVTFDHRIIDGSDAARFTNAVVAKLQEPADKWNGQF